MHYPSPWSAGRGEGRGSVSRGTRQGRSPRKRPHGADRTDTAQPRTQRQCLVACRVQRDRVLWGQESALCHDGAGCFMCLVPSLRATRSPQLQRQANGPSVNCALTFGSVANFSYATAVWPLMTTVDPSRPVLSLSTRTRSSFAVLPLYSVFLQSHFGCSQEDDKFPPHGKNQSFSTMGQHHFSLHYSEGPPARPSTERTPAICAPLSSPLASRSRPRAARPAHHNLFDPAPVRPVCTSPYAHI